MIDEEIGFLWPGKRYRSLQEEPVEEIDADEYEDKFHVADCKPKAKVRILCGIGLWARVEKRMSINATCKCFYRNAFVKIIL